MDDYTLTHQKVFSKSETMDQRIHPSPPNRSGNGPGQSSCYNLRSGDRVPESQGDATKKGNRLFPILTCYYCKRKGHHIMSKCWALEKKKKADLVVMKTSQHKTMGRSKEENDFISEGRVLLMGMDALRDTGAS